MQGRHSDTDKRTDLRTQQKKEWVGLVGRAALKHILPHVKRIAGGKLLCKLGSSIQCSVTTHEVGWGGGLRRRRPIYKHG